MTPTTKILLGVVGVIVVAAVAAVAAAWKPDRPVASLKPRWAGPPSRFVPLDGMEVHVRDVGARDDPTPIVLLHGTGSSLHTWQGWVDRLQGAHRVITLDRPGFGLTGPNPSGDYGDASYAGFLARLLDGLGVRRAIVVGNSSGGRMAWSFAEAHPDRVAALALLAPGGYPRTTPFPVGLRIAQSRLLHPLLYLVSSSQVAQGVRANYGDPSKVTPEAVERSYELMQRSGNREALGETLRQGGGDGSARIARVKAPTLILWGTRDTVIPPDPNAERFHHAVAGSTLVMLPGVGHVSQEEAPAETEQAFAQWLARIRPG